MIKHDLIKLSFRPFYPYKAFMIPLVKTILATSISIGTQESENNSPDFNDNGTKEG